MKKSLAKVLASSILSIIAFVACFFLGATNPITYIVCIVGAGIIGFWCMSRYIYECENDMNLEMYGYFHD